jgi:S-adenosylmethionine:tRNA ribosyltransferase-isomerase
MECLVSDDKNFKPGAEIAFGGGITLRSRSYTNDGILFELEGREVVAFLEQYGQMPLPPYIQYAEEKEKRYQTHFAQELGSAAAPTASLHFTPELLEALQKKGVGISFSTLHVGLGTFKPVYCEDIRSHPIHQETMIIDGELWETIAKWKKEEKNLIPVGTTMVRLLETLPYVRAKERVSRNPNESSRNDGLPHPSESERKRELSTPTQQFWESLTKDITTEEAEKFVKSISVHEKFLTIETQLFIYPGFPFRLIDQMITNFHLPKSSLLMLISALMGREEALKAYAYAIQQNYQFYSFGDGMWIRTISTLPYIFLL